MSAKPAEHQLDPIYTAASRTLRLGFWIAATLLTVGLTIAGVRGEGLNPAAEPLGEIIPLILDGHAAGLIDLAIVTIVLTPIVTTFVIAIGFFRLGDRLYGLLSLLVLAILGFSISLALFR